MLSTVSVIIPIYNGEAHLRNALASALTQTLTPNEVIVIDDGSTDSSAAIAQSLPQVTYRYQENAGPAAARNTGLALASSRYIAFLDADDLWPADNLSTLASYLDQHPEALVVVGRIQYMYLEGSEMQTNNKGIPIGVATGVNLPAAMFRCEAFERVGIFNPEWRLSEDVEWYMRAAESGIEPDIIETITLIHQIHTTNMTLARAELRKQLMNVLKASLDRRRKTGQVSGKALLPWVGLHEAANVAPAGGTGDSQSQ
jgi:glycosyltransferase involved in cell wall biosynthesis